MTGTVAFVLGTRPEIIKLTPLIRECERRDEPFSLVHTGQHYSDELDSVFFEQLELPQPDHQLGVGSKPHGAQTGAMIAEIERVLLDDPHEIVVVQGDTNSVLAGAIATSKLDARLGHVEAGLRSFDRDMPEEVNRKLADHAADYLFAPTERAEARLAEEGVPDERIYLTGNTVVDAAHANLELAERKSTALSDNDLSSGEFALLTVHRAENVDDPDRFGDVLKGVALAAADLDRPVLYPIHPRARESLREFDLEVPGAIELVEPLDYLDFLLLERHADVVFTDSGGVQEETCILGTPCITVRDSTERQETISVGANLLVGTEPALIRRGARTMAEHDGDWENPFGDGTAGERILDVLLAEPEPLEVTE
jgi:UDP-N-acetylglucosamine 2-epimerase (non-hydrolysing)